MNYNLPTDNLFNYYRYYLLKIRKKFELLREECKAPKDLKLVYIWILTFTPPPSD